VVNKRATFMPVWIEYQRVSYSSTPSDLFATKHSLGGFFHKGNFKNKKNLVKRGFPPHKKLQDRLFEVDDNWMRRVENVSKEDFMELDIYSEEEKYFL
ncbi:hypothetical protein ACJX0J_032653, partial [Zea mays]